MSPYLDRLLIRIVQLAAAHQGTPSQQLPTRIIQLADVHQDCLAGSCARGLTTQLGKIYGYWSYLHRHKVAGVRGQDGHPDGGHDARHGGGGSGSGGVLNCDVYHGYCPDSLHRDGRGENQECDVHCKL